MAVRNCHYPIVVSELQLMMSSIYGMPKLWASVSSQVHICATKYRQLIMTCTCVLHVQCIFSECGTILELFFKYFLFSRLLLMLMLCQVHCRLRTHLVQWGSEYLAINKVQDLNVRGPQCPGPESPSTMHMRT